MLQLPDTTTGAGQTEASVMLARLMGLAPQLFSDVYRFRQGDEEGEIFTSGYPHGWYHRMPVNEAWKFFPNLYDPANMALAWRVLNWAATQTKTVKAQKGGGDESWQESWATFIDDAINGNLDMYSMPPAAAQRAWLDGILGLAIEAGMVDAAAEG